MVSINTNVRLFAQQAALNAFRDPSSDGTNSSTSSDSSSMSLADYLFTDDSSNSDDGGFDDTQLSALIAQLQQSTNGTEDDTQDDGSVDDISSKAFMKAVLDKIDSLKNNPDTAAMADKMKQALEAGTMTITNSEAGEQIAAYDPNATTQPAATQAGSGQTGDDKTGDDQNPPEPTTIATTDWSSYLKNLLARDTNGTFIRNGDSSYIEKASGASSYFGMVGDAYYYISWKTPSADGSASSGKSGTPATSSTSTGA